MQSVSAYKKYKEWAAFLIVALFGFGTTFFLIKIALKELSPVEIATYRVTIAALSFWALVPVMKIRLTKDVSTLLKLCFAGMVGIAIPFTLVAKASEIISSGLAGIISSLTPIFTVILSAIFISKAELTKKIFISVVIGFIGVLLILHDGVNYNELSIDKLVAQLFVILASLCYAVLGVFIKVKLQKHNPITISLYSLTFASIYLWIVLIITQPELRFPRNSSTIISLLWMGTISSALAQCLIYYLMQSWSAIRVSLISYVIPIIATIMGVLFLDEKLSTLTVIGGIMIIFSIFIVNIKK